MNLKVSYIIHVLMLVTAILWARPLIGALNSVPTELAFEQERKAVHDAIQGVHAIPGTLRGWLCKPVDAAKDQLMLAQVVAAIIGVIEKYVPEVASTAVNA